MCICPNFNCSKFSLPTSAHCSACIPRCIACKNVTVCSRCENGYDVRDGTCVQSTRTAISTNTIPDAIISANPPAGITPINESPNLQTNNATNSTSETNSSGPSKLPTHLESPAITESPNLSNENSTDVSSNHSNRSLSKATVSTQNNTADVLNDIVTSPEVSTFRHATCSENKLYDQTSDTCVNCPNKCKRCEFLNISFESKLSCTECTSEIYELKAVGEVTLCISKSADKLFFSAIILGCMGAIIALIASVYCLWSMKVRQKRYFAKNSTAEQSGTT